ncbi:hypothetical protein [Shewanella sp. MF08487]|uniref:hypothetical protein n=1 Tax=Shewanella sp. MF08487 TaxID=3434873 RepID=UPI003D7A6769
MDEQELPLVAGTTFDFSVKWEAESDAGGLQPVNITGCSISLQVRNAANELLLDCNSVAGDITSPEPANGQIFVHIAPSKTVGKTLDAWADARWELRVTFPSGDAYSLVRGWSTLSVGAVQ